MLTESKLLTYSALIPILLAFQKKGVFEELKNSSFQGLSAEELSAKLDLKAELFEPLCDFLVLHLPEYFCKNNEKYLIKEAFFDDSIQNNIFFSLAYKPVFDNLEDLLSGAKQYGVNVVRDGLALSESSEIYNSQAWGRLVEILATKDLDTVVDIGCGTGNFLKMLRAKIPDIACLGIEVDKTVVEKVRQDLEGTYVDINVGDISNPEEWERLVLRNSKASKVALVGVTVWHEILFQGEEYFLSVIKKYKNFFPGSLVMIVEYDAVLNEDLFTKNTSLKNSASVYQLIHPLTLQGDPKPMCYWKDMLEKAGVTIESIESVKPNSIIISAIL